MAQRDRLLTGAGEIACSPEGQRAEADDLRGQACGSEGAGSEEGTPRWREQEEDGKEFELRTQKTQTVRRAGSDSHARLPGVTQLYNTEVRGTVYFMALSGRRKEGRGGQERHEG